MLVMCIGLARGAVSAARDFDGLMKVPDHHDVAMLCCAVPCYDIPALILALELVLVLVLVLPVLVLALHC